MNSNPLKRVVTQAELEWRERALAAETKVASLKCKLEMVISFIGVQFPLSEEEIKSTAASWSACLLTLRGELDNLQQEREQK